MKNSNTSNRHEAVTALSAVTFTLFLFILFTGCKKDKPETKERKQEYFEGKVNGQEFERLGYLGCASMSVTYYPDGFLEYEPGYFVFSVRNCELGRGLALGVYSNLKIGAISTCNDTISNPFCRYRDSQIFSDESPGFLFAHVCESIDLEILDIKPFESESSGYVEGTLDAIVRDTILDSTIVVSDVKFRVRL
jgi:hypothetical protein